MLCQTGNLMQLLVIAGAMLAASFANAAEFAARQSFASPFLPYVPWVYASALGQPIPVPNYVPQGYLNAQSLSTAQFPSNPLDAPASLPTYPLTLDQVLFGPYSRQQAPAPGPAQAPANPPAAPANPPAAAPATNTTSTAAANVPMNNLLSTIANFFSLGMQPPANFGMVASMLAMAAGFVARVVLLNLPLIATLFGLARASTARVIVDGITRAQCMERAACLIGQHANNYEATPQVLRWIRNPDPRAPEHPVFEAFRRAAEGGDLQCERYTC